MKNAGATFGGVLGQDEAASRLLLAAGRDRVAHAYAFQGPQGVGKALVAAEFGKLLLCQSPQSAPCSECRSCRLMAASSHPDFHVVAPDEGKRFISVEQVRDLGRRVALYPTMGTRKVFVIRDADDLRDDAQNMLLKTLEEPPADSVIILLTARPHRLAPTILSRCQKVHFRPLTPEHIREILARRSGAPAEDVEFAAHYAAGSAGDAMAAVAGRGLPLRDELLAHLEQLRSGSAFRTAEIVWKLMPQKKSLEEQRDLMRFLLEMSARLYRDLYVLGAGGGDAPLFNADRQARLREWASRLGPSRAATAADRLLRARADIDRNANIRLALEAAFVDLAQLAA